jgi:hypothetical protein
MDAWRYAVYLNVIVEIVAVKERLQRTQWSEPRETDKELSGDALAAELLKFFRHAFHVLSAPGLLDPLVNELTLSGIRSRQITPVRLCIHLDEKSVSMKALHDLRTLELSALSEGRSLTIIPSRHRIRKAFRLLEQLACSKFGGEVSQDGKFFTLDIESVLLFIMERNEKFKDECGKALNIFDLSTGEPILKIICCGDGTNLGCGRGIVSAGINVGGSQSRKKCFVLTGYVGKETSALVRYYLSPFYRCVTTSRVRIIF